MASYCSACGQPLPDDATFCSQCGFRTEASQPYPPQGQPYPTQGQPYPMQGQPFPPQRQPYPMQGQPFPPQGQLSQPQMQLGVSGMQFRNRQQKQMLPPKRRPGPARVIRRILLLTIVLGALGYSVLQAVDTTGLWQQARLKLASGEWNRQDDRKQEEEAVLARLDMLARALAGNDRQAILNCFHPNVQEMYGKQFNEHPDKLRNLAVALRDARLTFLSSADENYEYERMAQCEVRFGDEAGNAFTVTLVKVEGGWVVEKL